MKLVLLEKLFLVFLKSDKRERKIERGRERERER